MTRLTTCGFCGLEFDPDQAEPACSACPLVQNCSLICCPRCGYQMPPEAKLVQWLRCWGKSSQPAQHSSIQEKESLK